MCLVPRRFGGIACNGRGNAPPLLLIAILISANTREFCYFYCNLYIFGREH